MKVGRSASDASMPKNASLSSLNGGWAAPVLGATRRRGAMGPVDISTSVPEWRGRFACSACGDREVDMVVIGTEERQPQAW